MKVISLMVDFLKIIKLWHLVLSSMVRGNFLPYTIELNTYMPKFDEFYKINQRADNFHI